MRHWPPYPRVLVALARPRIDPVPGSGSVDRELPAVLVALTFITGLVDAVTHLALGRVFAANMTGSILVLGFALASLLLGAAAGAALLQRGPTAGFPLPGPLK